MESLFGEETPGLLPEEHVDILFDGPHDHERWDVRWRHGKVAVERFTYEPTIVDDSSALKIQADAKSATTQTRELYVILSIKRGDNVSPMRRRYEFRRGDVAAVAVYVEKYQEAVSQLAERGWQPTGP